MTRWRDDLDTAVRDDTTYDARQAEHELLVRFESTHDAACCWCCCPDCLDRVRTESSDGS